jgi:hypothetical protein
VGGLSELCHKCVTNIQKLLRIKDEVHTKKPTDVNKLWENAKVLFHYIYEDKSTRKFIDSVKEYFKRV